MRLAGQELLMTGYGSAMYPADLDPEDVSASTVVLSNMN